MSRKQHNVFWPTLALVFLALTAAFLLSARNRSAAAQAESSLPAQRTSPEFKQHIRVFIHGDDIRPKVIRAWPGKAVINIENEAKADVSLQIEKLLPNLRVQVGTVSLVAQSKRREHEVMLLPGEYVLYEASRPGLRCQLIVEPRR